jgi:hypothetical protein
MQQILKTMVVGAMCALGLSAAVASAATNPLVGTWNLDVAKSTFVAGAVPRGQTRIYADSAAGLVSTIKTTAADGKETTSTNTLKADGKAHPYSGNPAYDMISVKQLNANTREFTTLKGSIPIGKGQTKVSKDGKTLTMKYKGVNETGAKLESTSVYDRQ